MHKDIIKLGGILCIITLVVTVLLAGVNLITKDTIAANTIKTENEARSLLVKAESFEKVSEGIYKGLTGNEVKGFCVSVKPKGYGGDIDMMVGFNADGTITGIKIIEHSETAGLGANASSPEFSNKLQGKKAPITVKKSGASGNSEIDAISGATITTDAVSKGINEAFEKLTSLGLIK